MTNDQAILNLADCGAIVGLGNTLSPYTVSLEDSRIIVTLEKPVTRRKSLEVWDAVQLATESCDVIVHAAVWQDVYREPVCERMCTVSKNKRIVLWSLVAALVAAIAACLALFGHLLAEATGVFWVAGSASLAILLATAFWLGRVSREII